MSINNRQLAHLWASQNRPSGKASNFFFDGPTIYSYGRHFPIARFVETPRGVGLSVVLFTTRGYSNSTQRHISYTRQALHGLGVRVFDVLHVSLGMHADNFADYKTRCAAALLKASRARSNREWMLRDLQSLIAEGNLYRETFEIDAPPIETNISDEAMAEAREIAKRHAREHAEQLAQAKARFEREAAEQAEDWRAGRANGTYLLGSFATMLRVNGEMIETSRGASVPVTVARNLWMLVTMARAGKSLDYPKGSRVGDFELRQVTAEGDLIIGCHELKYDELAKLAATLGLA